MAIRAEFDGISRQVRLCFWPFHRRSVDARHAHAASCDLRTITVFEIDDAPRHLQQGRSIGCSIIAFIAQPQQQRRAFTSDDHPFRLGFAQNGQRIGALQLGNGGTHSDKKIRRFLEFGSHQMRDDFGIGV